MSFMSLTLAFLSFSLTGAKKMKKKPISLLKLPWDYKKLEKVIDMVDVEEVKSQTYLIQTWMTFMFLFTLIFLIFCCFYVFKVVRYFLLLSSDYQKELSHPYLIAIL